MGNNIIIMKARQDISMLNVVNMIANSTLTRPEVVPTLTKRFDIDPLEVKASIIRTSTMLPIEQCREIAKIMTDEQWSEFLLREEEEG